MKQPIAGVAAPETSEVTIAVVWPSIAAMRVGRALGRGYVAGPGYGWLTAGKLLAVASIPIVLGLFGWNLRPWAGPRYRLTNRRLAIEHGVRGRVAAAICLTEFDRVAVEVLPGHAWYWAGDLVCYRGEQEVFRLPGVARPEGFRQTIAKSALAFGSSRFAASRA